ncbi:type II toxin-antitoxin system VapC family toxin [Duganella sp. Dugasp56]|uniref:type II toxin-antitoxin system VapC family toxin n=1 Tax=Duganella sp. Dugasp56 TaxID=3243046 RepID=UPI0039B00A16
MKLLLDTHILLWAISTPAKLSRSTATLLSSVRNDLVFSVVSLWEVAIKTTARRSANMIDVRVMRQGLLNHGYYELPVQGEHALFVEQLPPLHRDPFDRMLVAQAWVEGMTLVTADKIIARYPGRIHQA